MTGQDSLALLIASGVQAEAVVRAAAEQLDADWRQLIDLVNITTGSGTASGALAKLEAIAPYRALLGAVVATWDGPAETPTDVVRIGGAS